MSDVWCCVGTLVSGAVPASCAEGVAGAASLASSYACSGSAGWAAADLLWVGAAGYCGDYFLQKGKLMMSEPTSTQRLIGAMLGEEYRDLYLHEAWFKVAVDQVAMFVVPALVRGLAIKGAEEHWERERQIEDLKHLLPIVEWRDDV